MLLVAELRKLRRPLTYWTIAAAIVLTLLLDLAGQENSAVNYPADPSQMLYNPVPCPASIPVASPECTRYQFAHQNPNDPSLLAAKADARVSAAGRSALGAGRFAAGMTASLVGAAALLLIGAGHVGGEFSGRSVKSILVEDPRRWRFLLAKAASLWFVGVSLMVLTWAALAVASLKLDNTFANGRLSLSNGQLLGDSLTQCARALLVLAVFTALCILAAVLTRNTLGTLGASLGVVLASLALTQTRATARWNLAYPVTGWMHFRPGATPADYLWLVTTPAHVPAAGPVVSLAALLIVLVLIIVSAVQVFNRADVRS